MEAEVAQWKSENVFFESSWKAKERKFNSYLWKYFIWSLLFHFIYFIIYIYFFVTLLHGLLSLLLWLLLMLEQRLMTPHFLLLVAKQRCQISNENAPSRLDVLGSSADGRRLSNPSIKSDCHQPSLKIPSRIPNDPQESLLYCYSTESIPKDPLRISSNMARDPQEPLECVLKCWKLQGSLKDPAASQRIPWRANET